MHTRLINYKSRHCLGDLSNSFREFGYRKIVRNVFETAHAKGSQDAAGGFLKNQADLAVVRGKTSIQSAKDFFDFCNENLIQPKSDGGGFLDILKLFREPNHGFINQF